ncbi:out at first protein isoform X2 [Bacillus rossius redtenbacheri]|uniref:out at first protein isoform X2 n=1 Tax=Bacillus rossius redtenbacheri TaxID=93214 RepID=UPI002FDDD585
MFLRRNIGCTYCATLLYILYSVNLGDTQLLINVKNQGGDVLQETISANVTEDVVTLEFQRSDGTLVTQLVDFRNGVQILKALVLGEEERGQSQYQVMCFVCHFQKGEFISSDAMAKLRQKNPGTIRTPEEDRGRDNHTMDLFVDVARSGVISRHIASLCAEARDATYTRQLDVTQWAAQPGSPRELGCQSSVRPASSDVAHLRARCCVPVGVASPVFTSP